jgi:hypothetical protein
MRRATYARQAVSPSLFDKVSFFLHFGADAAIYVAAQQDYDDPAEYVASVIDRF